MADTPLRSVHPGPSAARLGIVTGVLLLMAALPLTAQSGEFHDITDERTIADPFHRSLTGTTVGATGEDIPTAAIVARCADSDGCQVRVMITVGPVVGLMSVFDLPAIKTRTLFVTPDGDHWAVYEADDTLDKFGALSSDPSSFLVTAAQSSNISTCGLREKESTLGFVRYHLEADLDFDDWSDGKTVTCRLSVSD